MDKDLFSSLNQWQVFDSHIEKEFVFSTFKEAIAFINLVGEAAEKLDHHPEIYNVYNKVKLVLSTHDTKGLTIKDYTLGKQIDLIEY